MMNIRNILSHGDREMWRKKASRKEIPLGGIDIYRSSYGERSTTVTVTQKGFMWTDYDGNTWEFTHYDFDLNQRRLTRWSRDGTRKRAQRQLRNGIKRKRVIRAMSRERAMTVLDIAKETDLTRMEVVFILRMLERDGKVKKVGNTYMIREEVMKSE